VIARATGRDRGRLCRATDSIRVRSYELCRICRGVQGKSAMSAARGRRNRKGFVRFKRNSYGP